MSVSFKYYCEYLSLRIVAAVVRNLPRQAALGLGRFMGLLATSLMSGRYRLAYDNMSKAMPELTDWEIRRNLRQCFVHFGMSGVELLRLDLFNPDELDQFFEIEGFDHLREALDLGRGVILLTGHLGFWEAGAFVMPASGVECDMVGRPMKNPLTDAYLTGIRTHFGARLLNSRKGGRRIFKSLAAGHAVAVLLDQHISPPGSTETVFFGRKAMTSTVMTHMAMKHQIPVVPMFCLRSPDNRYKAWTEPMLLLQGDGEDAVAQNTQLLTDIVEAAIRRDVTQWFWMHKRWRVKKARKKRKK